MESIVIDNLDFCRLIICMNCKTTPIIKPIDFNEALVSCKCHEGKKKRMSYKTIYNKFFLFLMVEHFHKNKMKEYTNIFCSRHNKKFRYYCNNHEINYCENCEFDFCQNIELHSCENCTHTHHGCDIEYIIDFKNLEFDILYKILYTRAVLYELMSKDNTLIKIFETLCFSYRVRPNYNIIESINNIYHMAEKIGKKNAKKEKNILDLTNMQLFDLSILTLNNVRNLKVLILKNNKLGNKHIVILKKLRCKYLEKLNLELNYFTDYLLLTLPESFEKLKELNLGSNRLHENKDILLNKIIKYNSIEKLILSNGVLSFNNINDLISHFLFENLEYLDLSSNGLNSLSFIRNINFEKNINKLKTIILYYNNISIDEIRNDGYLDFLISKYLNLEQLILEKDYPTKYNVYKKNLPFIIQYLDENKISNYLLDDYFEDEKESESKPLPEYQQFYENKEQ